LVVSSVKFFTEKHKLLLDAVFIRSSLKGTLHCSWYTFLRGRGYIEVETLWNRACTWETWAELPWDRNPKTNGLSNKVLGVQTCPAWVFTRWDKRKGKTWPSRTETETYKHKVMVSI